MCVFDEILYMYDDVCIALLWVGPCVPFNPLSYIIGGDFRQGVVLVS